MTEVTTSGVVKWTSQDPASLVQMSQAMGDSIETAFSKRERYDYVWANNAERIAQTGMVQGSRGYQSDTKSEYLYDNSNWRLAASYAEYTCAVQSTANAVYTGVGSWSIVSANTTDSTFVSVSTNVVTFVNPGIYSMSMITGIGTSGTNGLTTISLTTTPGTAAGDRLSVGAHVVNISDVSLSLYRVPTANFPLYLYSYQNSGSAQNVVYGTLRVGRIG